MFKNEFQGGPYFEVFSAQGKDPVAYWKLSSSGIKKAFDKEVKSFVFNIEGSASTTRMQLPKDSKGSLTLTQRYIVFQICVPKGPDFSIDLGILDMTNQRRRLMLSTTYKETQTNPLHSKIPLGFLKRSQWVNLVIDVLSLVGEIWNNQSLQCLECICISGNCRLRRIFTMKAQAPDTSNDEELYGFTGTNSGVELDTIPRLLQLAPDLLPQGTQVVNMNKVWHYEGKGRPQAESTDLDLSSSGGKKSMTDAYHIAFGTKVPGQQSRKSSAGKEGSNSSRLPKYHSRSKLDAGADVAPVSSHAAALPPRGERSSGDSTRREKQHAVGTPRERKNSDPGANLEDPEITVDKGSLKTSHTWTDGADNKEDIPYVKPHPPRQPSSEKTRRPRVKSANKERAASHSGNKDELVLQSVTSSAYSSMNSSQGALNASQPQSRGSSGQSQSRGGSGHSQSRSGSGHSQSRGGSGQSQSSHATNSAGSSGTARRRRVRDSDGRPPPAGPQPRVVANDDEVARIMQESIHDCSRSETESELSSHNNSGTQEADDSISEVISTLKKHKLLGACRDEAEEEEEDGEDVKAREYEDSDEETEEDADCEEEEDDDDENVSKLYQYSSPPYKLVPRGPQSVTSNAKLIKNPINGHRPKGRRKSQEGSSPGKTTRAGRRLSNGQSDFVRQNSSDDDDDDSVRTRPTKRTSPRHRPRNNKHSPRHATKPRNGMLQVAPPMPMQAKSPFNSQTRQSIKKDRLREIPKDELRISGGQKPYDHQQYVMEELSESYEARMLQSMMRDSVEEDNDDPRESKAAETNRQQALIDSRMHYDDGSLNDSMDDTMSTMKARDALAQNHYSMQQEMHNVISSEFLDQSNPRDWGNVFSPPIVVPSAMQQNGAVQDLSPNLRSKREMEGREPGTDGEEELDLLYDPVLNCYYDPKSCKYYELTGV